MEFYEDKARNILLYPTQSPFLIQALPDARTINGQYLAVPKTLRNLQILKHYDHPVPPVITDENYDWPIAKGRTPLPHQKLMANFAVLHPRSFNLSDMGCVDCETEYLSPTGWRRINQYDGGKVAQYHKEGHVSFVWPTQYVVRPCKEMYRFKTTRGVDQKLSAEHRVLHVKSNGDLAIISARDIAAEHDRLVLGWRGRFITAFQGGQSGIPLSDAHLRLMVAVIADGHFPNQTHYCVISVKKERKKSRLRKLLADCGLHYEEKQLNYASKPGHTKFTFSAPKRHKEFNDYYWRASQAQLQIVCDEFPHWDGSKGQGNRGPSFFSVSKASADFIQYALTATGKTSYVTFAKWNKLCEGYQVTSRKKAALIGLKGFTKTGEKTKPITIEPTTDGMKYCFEVPTTFLVLRRNGNIFVTGNTMKTISMLWAADWLMKQHPKGEFRALIVAPLSTLQRVWADTIFANFLGNRTFEILHGDAARRSAGLARKADFSIINFDGVGVGAHTRKRLELDGFSRELAERQDIKLVIADEASAYKDAQTKRHRLARLIIGQKPYLWLLTGTPTPNAPTDAYGLAKLVNNAFGKSFTTFQAESMYKVSQFKWLPQKDGYDKARQLLSPSIRFAITDVWNGPEMTVQQREVPLTDQQKKLMADLKKDLQVVVKSGVPITATNEAAARQKFMQISLGAVYDAGHKAHHVDAKPRIAELKEIIEQAPGKLLILVPLTSVVNLLYKELDAWPREVVNGDTSQKARSGIFQAFQSEGGPRLLIADPGTMAHGLDLWMARTVVWYGPTDKTELYLQANKRAHRPGQQFPVTVVQLVSNKLEQEIYRRLENNTSLQGALLEMIRKGDL